MIMCQTEFTVFGILVFPDLLMICIGPEGPSATEPILPIMELMSSPKATEKQSAVRSQPKSRVRMNKRKRLTLPFHPFTVSKSDIRFLFEVRLEKNVTQPISYTTVLCEKVLQQQMPQRLNNLANSERLNMVIQIPELSAVVVGNPVGRVALLTMTKFSKIEKHYGFRVDWILPFKSQEDQYQRPECPLMGMAVGPIQGREMMRASTSGDSPGSFCTELHTSSGVLRRYRLFLIYFDHTTLTFEIGRSPSDTVHGFHDGDLVF